MKRFCFFFLILFFSVCSLFAEHFIIENYVFDISGKTKESAVRALIVPGGKEEFNSEDDLVAALDRKVQTLNNKRVFKSVSYSLEERFDEENVFVTVFFDIDDAHTFLAIPYPKYDTNVGAIIGLKMFDTNVLGNFADFSATVRAIFPPESFGTPKYDAKIDLSGLKVGKYATFSSSFLGYTDGKEFTYSASLNNLYVLNYYFNTSFGLEKLKDKEIYKYTLSSSFNNFSIFGIRITPSFSLLLHDDKTSSNFKPNLNISNIVLGPIRIDFNEYAEVALQNIDNEYIWKAKELKHSTSINFLEAHLAPLSISNDFIYTVDNRYDINTTFKYRFTDQSMLLFTENVRILKDNSVYRFDTGIGVSQSINIGSFISITPTLSEFLRVEKHSNMEDLIFKRYYVVSASAGNNNINWRGNFREGISYSVSVNESWIQEYSTRTINPENALFDHFEFTAHKVFGSWFNPSFRILVNYTSDIGERGSILGGKDLSFASYIRGVRDVTTYGYNQNVIGIVASLNLMAKFPLPAFFSFVDAYVNAFFDYGIAKPNDNTDAKNFYGFGIEGIGILKSFPSYPLRVSVGFDLEKLTKFANKEGGRDFYEIYIGLGFFF